MGLCGHRFCRCDLVAAMAFGHGGDGSWETAPEVLIPAARLLDGKLGSESAAVVTGKLLRRQWQLGWCMAAADLAQPTAPRRWPASCFPISMGASGRQTKPHPHCRGEVHSLPAALPRSQPAWPPRPFCGRGRELGLLLCCRLS